MSGPPPAPMTAQKALEVARLYKAMAAYLADLDLPRQAALSEHDAARWQAYASTLDAGPS